MTERRDYPEPLARGWARAGITLAFGCLWTFAILMLIEAVISRGCTGREDCSASQSAAAALALLAMVGGLLVLGVLGWTGRLPGTRVDHYRSGATFLDRSSVTLVVVLTIVSAGFYVPVWFQRRREALNSLESPVKVWEWGPPAVLVLHASRFAIPEGTTLQAAASLATMVGILMLSFRVRSILMDHSESRVSRLLPGALGIQRMAPSALLTVLFNHWYLQFKINQLIDESRAWEQPLAPLPDAPLNAISDSSLRDTRA